MLPAIIGEENGFFNLNVEDAEYLAHLAISKAKKGRLCNG